MRTLEDLQKHQSTGHTCTVEHLCSTLSASPAIVYFTSSGLDMKSLDLDSKMQHAPGLDPVLQWGDAIEDITGQLTKLD